MFGARSRDFGGGGVGVDLDLVTGDTSSGVLGVAPRPGIPLWMRLEAATTRSSPAQVSTTFPYAFEPYSNLNTAQTRTANCKVVETCPDLGHRQSWSGLRPVIRGHPRPRGSLGASAA